MNAPRTPEPSSPTPTPPQPVSGETGGPQTPPQPDATADLLRRAAADLDAAATASTTKGWTYAALAQAGDEWGALLAPPVATALAAWLRAEADHAADAQAYLDTHHGGVAPPGTWSTEYRHRHAVALALALLGVDQP